MTQVVASWQRKLSSLPNPLADGRMTLGLTGQLFLQGADGGATPAAGGVTFMVYDESPRATGVPERTPEMFEFDPVTLAKMRSGDERFGPCYVIFLPWPKDWGADVTLIRVATKYVPTAGPFPIPAAEVKVAMDYKGEGLTPVVPGSAESLSPAGARDFDTRGVPDAARARQQLDMGLTSPVVESPRPTPPQQPPAPPPTVPPPERPSLLLPAPKPAELPPGPPIGTFAPGGGMVIPPKNKANSPYATEGAWAAPPPPPLAKGPVMPVAGAPAPLMLPGPGI